MIRPSLAAKITLVIVEISREVVVNIRKIRREPGTETSGPLFRRALETRHTQESIETYFSSFLEIIHAHQGDVNETAGDGLMVIFEAGATGADHALNATRAAFAIRQRTTALNEEFAGLLQPIQLHMEINTGEALVGATKLGGPSSQRWTFTATGPTTNVAARLAAFAGAGEIAVGPGTAERIRSHFVLESLGERTFKNVSAPIRVYRVIPPGVYEKVV